MIGFWQMISLAGRDKMLAAACIAPFLAGIFFRFVIPFAEGLLIEKLEVTRALSPFYGLFDLTLSFLAPVMFCFVSAMIMLEERDDHITSYLVITGLGKKGYLISRLLFPAGMALLVTLLILPAFCLTKLTLVTIILLSLTGTAQGLIVSMLVLLFSANKLEGMAVTKLATLTLMGMLGPYFLPKHVQFYLYFLPSYWAGRAVKGESLEGGAWIPVIVTAVLWLGFVLHRYIKKAGS